VAWVIPRVWTVLEAVTAAKMNEISSSLTDLDRRTVAVAARVDTSETTGSTSYVSLATPGPSVTVTGSVTVLVAIAAGISNSGANASLMATSTSFIVVDIVNDNDRLSSVGTSVLRAGMVKLHQMSGTTTVKTVYAVSAGTGTFVNRTLVVAPLGQT
jgi:hypothetical protein